MQNCVVWKGKIWGKAGALLLGFCFSSFPSCQITFSVSLLKLQFLTLCSSHSSSGNPSFCLQLTGFLGTCLLACVISNDLPHFLLCSKNMSITIFTEHIAVHGTWYSLQTHTHTEVCCLERHVTSEQDKVPTGLSVLVLRRWQDTTDCVKPSQLTLPIYFVKKSVKSLCNLPSTTKILFLSWRSEDEPLITVTGFGRKWLCITPWSI